MIYFPVYRAKATKELQELQGPKYMPHLSVTGIRISLVFEGNATDSVLEELIRSSEHH